MSVLSVRQWQRLSDSLAGAVMNLLIAVGFVAAVSMSERSRSSGPAGHRRSHPAANRPSAPTHLAGDRIGGMTRQKIEYFDDSRRAICMQATLLSAVGTPAMDSFHTTTTMTPDSILADFALSAFPCILPYLIRTLSGRRSPARRLPSRDSDPSDSNRRP